MRRFWFQFDVSGLSDYPAGIQLGCGVTALDLDDALGLASVKVFSGRAMPPLVRVVSDVDVSTLDSRNVLPNMGNVLRRGIWFPLGYELTRF